MKKVLLGSLLAGGLLFGAKNNEATTRVSANERIALETQSPRVHPGKMHKHARKNARRMDQVVSDKHTVNAFIPQGK